MAHSDMRAGLCLVLEVASGAEARARIEAALQACQAATIVVAPAPGQALDAATVLPLIAAAQAKGIAALIEDDAQLARTAKADGVHLAWSKDIAARYAQAREILGTRALVGADAGRSRHDAMTLGEAGADYIAFGIPPHVDDRNTAGTRRLDLVAWWAEIFEIPVVAVDVATADEAQILAAAGVDFIAVRLAASRTAAEIAKHLASIAAAIRDQSNVDRRDAS